MNIIQFKPKRIHEIDSKIINSKLLPYDFVEFINSLKGGKFESNNNECHLELKADNIKIYLSEFYNPFQKTKDNANYFDFINENILNDYKLSGVQINGVIIGRDYEFNDLIYINLDPLCYGKICYLNQDYIHLIPEGKNIIFNTFLELSNYNRYKYNIDLCTIK